MAKMVAVNAKEVEQEMLATCVQECNWIFRLSFDEIDLKLVLPKYLPADSHGNPIWPCQIADQGDRKLARYLGLDGQFLMAAGSYDRVANEFTLLPLGASPNVLLVVVGNPELPYDETEFSDEHCALFYEHLHGNQEENPEYSAPPRDIWILPSVSEIRESMLRQASRACRIYGFCGD